MSPNNDFERKVAFILEQQAQFYSDLRRAEALIQRNSEAIQRNSEAIQRNSEAIQRNSEAIQRNSEAIQQLIGVASSVVGVLDSLNARAYSVDEQIRALVDSQKRTDDRLNVLIGVVERYFSNGH